MLYDVFICHASEDKDDFVRPLAEALRSENVDVWYDEFTLKLGDSIRRSLDRGLAQSRFGVVVLSHAFFNKNWPQYELDGLSEREMKGHDKIVLPIWHGVSHSDVIIYSPSLAGRKAVSSDKGIDTVVDAILDVVHPQCSPLIVARDILIEWGLMPPVITDQYWLEVTEASNRIPGFGAAIPDESSWSRWSFPLPKRGNNPKEWGEKLAWTAMQMNWIKTANSIPISPITNPNIVLEFINGHPGLLETCQAFPLLIAEYAPQLTISGMGGVLEPLFENQYKKSLIKHKSMKNISPAHDNAPSTNSDYPLCDEEWILRHPIFGGYDSKYVAYSYFNGGLFGPEVSIYYEMDHLVWLLSSISKWLPERIHNCLIEGMSNSTNWPWSIFTSGDHGGLWVNNGTLLEQIYKCLDKKTHFVWTKKAQYDTLQRIKNSVVTLNLPESPEELFNSFVEHKLPEKYIIAELNSKKRHYRKSSHRKILKQKADDTIKN